MLFFLQTFIYLVFFPVRMEIRDGFVAARLGLYVRKLNALVIGDVHIGYEEALNRRGVLLPRFHFQDVLSSLEGVFRFLESELVQHNGLFSEIIINGDLKHEFGSISGQEWREVLKLIDLLSSRCRRVVIVKGNHDVVLGHIAGKRNIVLVDDYSADGIFICHGHQIPGKVAFRKAKVVIIGNEHPAVSVREGPRVETFKCFLRGRFRGKDMIVMPSFNPVTIGTDVLKAQFISPFLKSGVRNFEVFVAADKVYAFGRVRDLE